MFLHNTVLVFLQNLNLACSVGSRRDFFQHLLDPYMTVEVSNLVMGLVFGGGNQLSRSFVDQVRVAGISHVLSASGSNVSLILLMNSNFIRKKFGHVFTIILSVTALICYLLVAGCTAPLIRASVTAVLSLLGTFLWKRKPHQMWLLGITCAVMIFISADYLTDLSFQLSVAACIGILCVPELFPDKKLNLLDVSIKELKQMCYQSNSHSASFSRVMHQFGEKTNDLRRWFLMTLLTTLAIQYLTLPIVIFYFHELSILGVVSNVTLIWIVPWIVGVTIATLLCSICHVTLCAYFFGQSTELLSQFFISITSKVGSNNSFLLHFSDWQSWSLLTIYFVLSLMLLVHFHSKKHQERQKNVLLCNG